MKEPPTKVIFRKFKEVDKQVIAFFPELPATNDPKWCSSYMHIGQHGVAQPTADFTDPATPKEYASLKRELESEPYNYNLRIVKRFSRSQYHKRKAAIASVN